MIVVDTNILVYLSLPGSYTYLAEKLLFKEPEWVAPLLWKSEFRNVLALYLRKNIISFEQALQLQEKTELMMAGHDFDVNSTHVLATIHSSHCSAYDCEFIVLANHLNTRLITQDKKLLNAFPTIAISVEDYLASFSHH